ncbi:hypothetical protein CPLU01_05660 [Colletotrichum plurivorum]|uniref:Uncharacterized protein n=1 Tax=Colletotrichum plurivorum TaxID=2175906 RepID=A0A8H6KKP4_9PEZI|nr:hypothetical protein CPLU01_05660 [Colletotrichum plurivorum]
MTDKKGKEELLGASSVAVTRGGSSPAPADDAPPSYTLSAENGPVQPDTLLLAGTTIYSAGAAASPPLYEVSFAIGHLRESNTTVSLSRFDQVVRTTEQQVSDELTGEDLAPQQVPRVSTRKKHIYDLKRALASRLTNPTFTYFLESQSRGTMGHFGLKTHRHRFGTASGYRAYKASRPRSHADLEPQDVAFVAKDRGKGRYEWRDGGSDGEKRLVAHETSENGIYKLQVVVPLSQKERDVLVALWCLHLWWEIASANVEPMTWEQGESLSATRSDSLT